MLTTGPGLHHKIFPDIPVTEANSKAKSVHVLFYTLVFSAVVFVINALSLLPASGITDLAFVFIPGFLLQSLVPVRYRPFIFCLVFVASLFYVFSPVSAVTLIIMLAVTAWVVYSNISRPLKYAYIICLTAGVLLARNTQLVFMPRLALTLPFAASILMFRLIILMYETKHSKLPDNHWLKLAYFFNFPNLAFLFYPVIDYKAYVRSYYSSSYVAICNKALWFMMSGIAMLICYKYLIYYSDISYVNVNDIYGLIILLLSKYCLVFKMVGLLTIGLGLLVMFGFDMPPVFGNFLFVTSFNEYWQRVNIYWKEFIVKIVYYPLYFKMRKKLKDSAPYICIVLALMSSFVFHGYQRFWLSGSFVFQLQDFAYWLILGFLVAYDAFRSIRNAKVAGKDLSFSGKLLRGCRLVVVFTTMLVLWYLWNSENVSAFFYIFKKGLHGSPQQYLAVGTGIAVIILCYALLLYIAPVHAPAPLARTKRKNIFSYAGLGLLLLLACLKTQLAENKLLAIATLPEVLNKDDMARKEAGYYSSIINIKNEDWEIGIGHMNHFSSLDKISISQNDLLFQVFKPNDTATLNGYMVMTNSYGLRDKEYALQKPANTYRIALLGGSYEMGSGVQQEEMYEKILEKELNKYYRDNPKIEILNFAMGAYTALPEMELMRTKVLQFHPDAVYTISHADEMRRSVTFFSQYIRSGVPLKYEYLLQAKRASGVKQSMSQDEIKSRIAPYMEGIYKWCYMQIDSMCVANNIKPVWIFLPSTNGKAGPAEISTFRQTVDSIGFSTYVLDSVYGNYALSKITVSETDPHPNALGHRLIANKLFNLLVDSTKHIIPIK